MGRRPGGDKRETRERQGKTRARHGDNQQSLETTRDHFLIVNNWAAPKFKREFISFLCRSFNSAQLVRVFSAPNAIEVQKNNKCNKNATWYGGDIFHKEYILLISTTVSVCPGASAIMAARCRRSNLIRTQIPTLVPDPQMIRSRCRWGGGDVERKTSACGKAVSDWINGETFLCQGRSGPPPVLIWEDT